MKKIITIFFIAFLFIFSCKKTGSEINKNELVGSWHLYAFGSVLYPQTPTDNYTLTFETSGKYKKDSNKITTETGNYSLIIQNSGSGIDTTINFSPIAGEEYQTDMNMRNDTLTLIPYILSTDGYFLSYARQ